MNNVSSFDGINRPESKDVHFDLCGAIINNTKINIVERPPQQNLITETTQDEMKDVYYETRG